MPGIGHNDDGSATGGDPGQGTSSSTSETTAVVESTTTTNTSGAVTNRPPGANADANANGGARGGMGILSTVSRLMFMYWVMSSLMGTLNLVSRNSRVGVEARFFFSLPSPASSLPPSYPLEFHLPTSTLRKRLVSNEMGENTVGMAVGAGVRFK